MGDLDFASFIQRQPAGASARADASRGEVGRNKDVLKHGSTFDLGPVSHLPMAYREGKAPEPGDEPST